MENKTSIEEVSKQLTQLDHKLVSECQEELARNAREMTAAGLVTPKGVKRDPKKIEQQVCLHHDGRKGMTCPNIDKGCLRRHLDTANDATHAERYDLVSRSVAKKNRGD